MKVIATGNGDYGQAEARALSEGTLSAGGYTVAVELSARVIDRARNLSSVMRAGALTIPMTTNALKVAKVDRPYGWMESRECSWHRQRYDLLARFSSRQRLSLHSSR